MSVKNYRDLDVNIKLSIGKEASDLPGTFGRGTVSLLQGVAKRGSLNQAAKAMNMAYSKAWRLVKEAEGHVGLDLIDRHGAHGSSLTPDGLKLLNAYLQIEQEASALASERFIEIMEDYEKEETED